MAKKAVKRNPNDATFRNINALKVKYHHSLLRIEALETRNLSFGERIGRLEELVRELREHGSVIPSMYPEATK